MSVTERATDPKAEDDDKVLEITLTDIVVFLKRSRRTIFLSAIVGALFGALYALSKPNVYTAQVTVMPEIQGKGTGGLGSLGSLAGLAGVSLDNLGGQDAIRPELYPTILQSVPFALDLLKQPVYSQKLKSRTTLQEFVKRVAREGFISRFLNLFAGADIAEDTEEKSDPKNYSQALQVTKEQDELIKVVQGSVTATYDKKTGIIAIVAIEPDPVVAATVARLSLEYLTTYITTYRTEKARKQVDFLVQQVEDSQKRYKATEYALSSYRDRNRSLFLNTAKIDEQRLQADYLLAQSVYTDLSKQLEQAKIKVQEETPIFKTLEPPTVPLRKSGPKRTIMVGVFCIVGALISIALLLVRYITRRPRTRLI